MEAAQRSAEVARDAMMQSFQAVDELQRQARAAVEGYLRYLPEGAGRSGLLPRFQVLDTEVDAAVESYLATLDARPLRDRARLEDLTQAAYAFHQGETHLRSLATALEQFLATYDVELRRVGEVLRRVEHIKGRGRSELAAATTTWTALRERGFDSGDADRALARARVAARHLETWSIHEGMKLLDELATLVARLCEEARGVAAAYPERVERARNRRGTLRTRFATLDLAGERVASRLSDLRREFSRPNSADLDDVPGRVQRSRALAMETFGRYACAVEASEWDAALGLLEELENLTDAWSQAVRLPEDRLERLRNFARAPQDEVARVRFVLRDAQMLVARSTRPNTAPHVAELDRLAARLDAVKPSESAHPDLLTQLRLLEEIRMRVADVVASYRGAGRPTGAA